MIIELNVIVYMVEGIQMRCLIIKLYLYVIKFFSSQLLSAILHSLKPGGIRKSLIALLRDTADQHCRHHSCATQDVGSGQIKALLLYFVLGCTAIVKLRE